VKTALVTGHAGFIGQHMIRHLTEAGYTICGVDLKQGGDCRTFFAKNTNHFDLVVHLAAIVGGRETIDGQPMAVAVDLAIDADLFQWALRTKPGRVVYFSSAAAYGNCYQNEEGRWLGEPLIDLDEGARIGKPDMTYGWAKLTGELQARFVQTEGIPVNVFRPFSGYASDQDAAWYPFPAFIDRAIAHAAPFDVWGSGTQTRDFIHVDDICRAVLAAVDQEYDGGPINLCTGRATSLNDLARLCMAEVGYAAVIRNLPAKPTGPQHRVGASAKLNEFYTAKVSLEEGIARAVKDRRP
jgi:nucleoside-diphosphate-sugar epimerase